MYFPQITIELLLPEVKQHKKLYEQLSLTHKYMDNYKIYFDDFNQYTIIFISDNRAVRIFKFDLVHIKKGLGNYEVLTFSEFELGIFRDLVDEMEGEQYE